MLEKMLLPVILLALTMLSGYGLAHQGRPLSVGLFTVHKLLALAATVLSVIQVVKLLNTHPIQPITWVMLGLASLAVVALFVSGALISSLKNVNPGLVLLHRIGPYFLIAAMAAFLFFLLKPIINL